MNMGVGRRWEATGRVRWSAGVVAEDDEDLDRSEVDLCRLVGLGTCTYVLQTFVVMSLKLSAVKVEVGSKWSIVLRIWWGCPWFHVSNPWYILTTASH